MNHISAKFAVLVIALSQQPSFAQCYDGICRLPERGVEPVYRQSGYRPDSSLSDPMFRSRRPVQHDGFRYDSGRQERCKDGICEFQPTRPSECPECGCKGEYCDCGPDRASHYHNDSRARPQITGLDLGDERWDPRYRIRPPVAGRGELRAPQPVIPASRNDDSTSTVEWMRDYERALEASRRTGRPLLVRVSAKWCQYCERMNREAYTDSNVIDGIRSGFIPVALDGDRDRRLIQQLGVKSLPTAVVISPNLQILDRVEGFRSARQLMGTIGRFARRAQLETGWRIAGR